MCLGDVKLASYLRWQKVEISVTNAWALVLEGDPNRVGIILPPTPAIATYWSPFVEDGTTQSGISRLSTSDNMMALNYADLGQLMSNPWYVLATAVGPNNVYIWVAVVPSEVIAKLQNHDVDRRRTIHEVIHH